jgi:hypothetical protein
MRKIQAVISRWIPHLLAGSLALYYAWNISHSDYVTTGVQFVSPLAVVLTAHLAWLAAARGYQPGFSGIVLGRSFTTTLGIVVGTAFAAIYAPVPAEASTDLGSTIGAILSMFACLAVLGLVLAAAAALLLGISYAVYALFNVVRRWLGRPPGAGETRLYDVGVLIFALLAIGTASLEGIVGAFSFAPADQSFSRISVAAPPARVWDAVGVATSPTFPLPIMLKSIPQPVAIVLDEGTALGAKRIVHFKGREGEGDLTLQVTERTNDKVVFRALSDNSPIAMWIQQKAITFRVQADGSGSTLTVTSDYDRLLSPSWFFKPYIRVAAFLAVDTLARDTKQRAEQP